MKNLSLTVCVILLAVSTIMAQEAEEKKDVNMKSEKFQFVAKSEKPDIYVDGKKFDFDLRLLNPDRFESFTSTRGKEAIEKYNSPNGVILITTKKGMETANSKIKINATDPIVGGENSPMIIIDDKVSTDKEALEEISPDDIHSIDIFKGKAAMELYNVPSVIVVVTKKGKK